MGLKGRGAGGLRPRGVAAIEVGMRGEPRGSMPDITSRGVAEPASMGIGRIKGLRRREAVGAMAIGPGMARSKLRS